MKKKIASLICSIFILNSFAQTNYPTGTSGCIARWTFDQDENFNSTITDWSGNNNHGTNVNIFNETSWRGIPNRSGSFNGQNSKSEVSNSPQLSPNQISIIALIKFNSFYSGDCQGNNIIYKGLNYNGSQDWSFFVSELDNNCTNVNPGMEKLHFLTPNFTYYAPPSNFIQPNQWYFLAITFDGVTIQHFQIPMDTSIKYSSIQPLYSKACSTGIGNGSYNITIGATVNPPFPFWLNGVMDELVLFNRALSNSEMESVYDYLWGIGAPNNIKNFKKEALQISCINKTIFIKDFNPKSVIKITIRSIDGKILKEFNTFSSNQISCTEINDQLAIISIYQTNGQVSSQKIILQ